MSNTTGYFLVGSKGTGLIIDPSIFTPSDVVKEKSSGAEYACAATHCETCALASIVRSLPRSVDQISTCRGCRIDDQRSMKYWPLGDSSMRCVPCSVGMRRGSFSPCLLPWGGGRRRGGGGVG